MENNDEKSGFEITQSSAWEAFQGNAGRNVHIMELDGGNTALFLRFDLPFGKSWLLGLGVPLSLFGEAEVKRLAGFAKKVEAVYIRFEGYAWENENVDFEMLFRTFDLRAPKKNFLPQYTVKIDLMASESDILAQMKRKGRYNIKVAKKEGVEIERYTGSVPNEVLDSFYKILTATGGRDKFGIHPKKYYKTMLDSLGKNVHLYMAKAPMGGPIAGIIVVYGKTDAVYYYGASSNAHRNLMAPYLLQWEAMKDAKNAGKTWYDFMGVARPANGSAVTSGVPTAGIKFNESDPLYGVTEFKCKFGGQLHIFKPAYDVILRPIWYIFIKIAKKLRG